MLNSRTIVINFYITYKLMSNFTNHQVTNSKETPIYQDVYTIIMFQIITTFFATFPESYNSRDNNGMYPTPLIGQVVCLFKYSTVREKVAGRTMPRQKLFNFYIHNNGFLF